MPATKVVIYQEADRAVPLLEWLDGLSDTVRIKCLAKIKRLAEFGYQLRRPDCDILRDGIYELRIRHGTMNYRILYGFAGKNIVLLSHGCTKERVVADREIEAAKAHLHNFRHHPLIHAYSKEI